jgi:hypothetical protein
MAGGKGLCVCGHRRHRAADVARAPRRGGEDTPCKPPSVRPSLSNINFYPSLSSFLTSPCVRLSLKSQVKQFEGSGMLLEGDLTYDITVRFLGLPAKGCDLESDLARAISDPRYTGGT